MGRKSGDDNPGGFITSLFISFVLIAGGFTVFINLPDSSLESRTVTYSSDEDDYDYEVEADVYSAESSESDSTESYSDSSATSYSEPTNPDYNQTDQSSDESKVSYDNYSSNDQYTPTDQGTNSGDGQTAPTQVNATGPIKASIDGWYHVPGQSYYDRVNRIAEYFQTEQEAIDAGYKRSRY